MRWGVLTRCFWQHFKRLGFAFAATLLFALLQRDGQPTSSSVIRINIHVHLAKLYAAFLKPNIALLYHSDLNVAEENCVSGIKIHLYVGRGLVRSLSLTYGEQ